MRTPLDEFSKLSWALLEAKVKYYLAPHLDNMSDSEYDALERRYVELCKSLDRPNTIQSMVGADQTRESVKLVMNKLHLIRG